MKIGDKVAFLNATGSGRVAGFQGKNIVLVEDEDGFRIPTPVADVIITGGADDYDTGKMLPTKGQKTTVVTSDNTPAEDPKCEEKRPRHVVEERKGGDALNCYLAFVPVDEKTFTTTDFDFYFVNDTNYYVRYALHTVEGSASTLLVCDEVEPNTTNYIRRLARAELNDYGRITVQMLAYKRGKPFAAKPPVDVTLRIDGTKFYKLHTFTENDFFDEAALVLPIVTDDRPVRPLVVDTKQLKTEMYTPEKEASGGSYVRRYDNGKSRNPFVIAHKGDADAVVVDLHAAQLLETTTGMSAADILNYQLDTARKTLEQYKKRKGQRIIFIHGKGEGVLRQALIRELKYRYKTFTYQDASFQQYGYGATQVTVK